MMNQDNLYEKPTGQQVSKPLLLAMDFDHTIIDLNSDTEILKLSPTPVPKEIKRIYDGSNWTEYMKQVFFFLCNNGVSVSEISDFSETLEPSKGVMELLRMVKAVREKYGPEGVQTIVISDANDLFIEKFFRSHNLLSIVDKIITNRINEEDCKLVLMPYEQQRSCVICPINLCKGKALEEFVTDHGPFESIFYVGDGENDICPALKLRSQDHIFIRKNYKLEKLVSAGMVKDQVIDIKAKKTFWDNATVITKELSEFSFNCCNQH